MAGTILTSLVFRTTLSAVSDSHACPFNEKQGGATFRSKEKIPKSHCLDEQRNFNQLTSVEKILYSIPLDSGDPCTESSNEPRESSASLYALAPGCPSSRRPE